VERYEVRSAAAAGSPAGRTRAPSSPAAPPGKGRARLSPERYAVLHHGRRVAWGFTSYDRARARAWSMHLDELALARRGEPARGACAEGKAAGDGP
jgi:hypothetical protein